MELKTLKISFKNAESFSMKTDINEIIMENVSDGDIELEFDQSGRIIMKENITQSQDKNLIESEKQNNKQTDDNLIDVLEEEATRKSDGNVGKTKPLRESKTIDKTKSHISKQHRYRTGTVMFTRIDDNLSKENRRYILNLIRDTSKNHNGVMFDGKDILPEDEKGNANSFCVVFGEKDAYDHPVKALYTALEIKRKLEKEGDKENLTDKSIRFGIDTGGIKDFQSLSLLPGSHESVSYQLMKQAQGGDIIASQTTHIRSLGLFTYDELKPVSVEGKKFDVDVYRITGEKKQPYLIEPDLLANNEVPLFGKEKQSTQLTEVWEKCYREGRTHITTISGIAESGKSRMARELLKYIEKKDFEVDIYHNISSTPDSKLIPMNAFKQVFLEKIKSLLDFSNNISSKKQASFTGLDKDSVDKIASFLKSIMKGKLQNTEESIDILLNLIGIKSDPTKMKKHKTKYANLEIRAFYILKTVMEMMSDTSLNRDNSPITLIIEDMQWIDDQSLRFIEYLSTGVRGRPLFLLCLTRPIFFNNHINWSKYKENSNIMEVGQLTSSERLDFIQSLLYKIDDVPADLVHKIAKTSSGNPSHIIELINVLIEHNLILINEEEDIWYPDLKGIKNYPLPSSLDYAVLVRYDTLSESEQEVVSIASAIGDRFNLSFMNKINGDDIDEILSRLIDKQLLYYKGNKDGSVDKFYFKAHYIRNSIYRSISKNRRMEYHMRIYQALTDLLDERIDNETEMLIHSSIHLLNIGNRSKATNLLMKAGDICMQSSSFLSALEIYNKISSAVNVNKHPDIALELYAKRGKIYLDIEDVQEAAKNFDALIAVSERNNRPEAECYAMSMLSQTFEKMNDLDRSYEYARSALSLAEKIEDVNQKTIANMCLARIFEKRGQLNYAEEYYHRTEVLVRTTKDKQQMSLLYQSLGSVKRSRGELDKSLNFYRQALSINRELENKSKCGDLLLICGDIIEQQGKLEEALDTYKEALQLSESIGDRVRNADSFEKCASILLRMGQADEALTYYLEAVEIKKEFNDKESIADIYFNIGEIYKNQDKMRKSTEYFDKALDIYNELDNKIGIALSLKYIADMYKKKENIRSALRCYEKSIEIMEQIQYTEGLMDTYKNIGDLYRIIGDNVKAVEYRAKITRLSKDTKK
jgi:predicted ATPase